MNIEFNFSFNELVIDYQTLGTVLGYENVPLPGPFDEYMEEALSEARKLTDIRAIYHIFEEVKIDEKKKIVMAGKSEFNVGKTVAGELLGSDRLAFFICTAGKTICEKSAILLKGENTVLGYVYDVLGSAIVEAAGDRMQFFLKEEIENAGSAITNRYSPGYCQWSLADQHKLFSLFDGSPCGVTLTPSALMYPVKSISGVIGIGRDVKYRDYQCTLCMSENCVYRRVQDKRV